ARLARHRAGYVRPGRGSQDDLECDRSDAEGVPTEGLRASRHPRHHLLACTARPLRGCTGRALCAYRFANAASSGFEISTACFRTNQVTSSLQGGVVSEPVKV